MQYDDHGSTTGESTGEWYRNYTMLYDNAKYAARWVAYSLSAHHEVLSSSLDRRSWDKNPSTTLTQYSGSYKYGSTVDERGYTYDKGHQIANMTRSKCSSNSQKQTFLYPNQMPQVASFNQGKWVSLENKEMEWKSQCDTMYVVTGPIFDSGYYTTPDSNDTPIPVATRYFKAIIKCNWTNGALSEVKGIGFLMDNVDNAASQAYTNAVTSIEEVEKACGFTLFVNLPSEFSAAKQNKTLTNF